MSRARRAADVAVTYGLLRGAIALLDDVLEQQPIGGTYFEEPGVRAAVDDVTAARIRLRSARDVMFQRVRHDVDPLERLELELDRAADEAGLGDGSA